METQEHNTLAENSGALVSPSGIHRYLLWRVWARTDAGCLAFVMLNPSTADGTEDDPTIRRCRNFALDHGYDGIKVVNLYAYRATKPADLWALDFEQDRVGRENDDMLREVLLTDKHRVTSVVCAWGAQPKADKRIRAFHHLVGRPMRLWLCLDLTKDGYPRHPLMVRRDQPLVVFGVGPNEEA